MAGTILIIIAGIWLITQTVAGGLIDRILAAGNTNATGAAPTVPAALDRDRPAGEQPAGNRLGPSPQILKVAEAVKASGIPVRGNPVTVCRPPNLGNGRTGSGWSQHAYGNAIDYYGTADALQRLYNFLKAHQSAGTLPISVICYNHQGPCSHPHTSHLHVAGSPRYTGHPTGCP